MGERLYGIVDAARDLQLAKAVRETARRQARSLFEGPLAERLMHVAPYVFPIDPRGPLLDAWAAHLGNAAGVLLLSEVADVGGLRDHLRKLFVITDEDAKPYSFRFYDPRVLRTYLPTCTPVEVREFFGPVARFIVEAAAPARMICYSVGCGGELQLDERPLEHAVRPTHGRPSERALYRPARAEALR
jgi:hypothetical protein